MFRVYCSGRRTRERQIARISGGVTERFLDAKQLVVLGDAFTTRRGTRLDLTAADGHRKVGDGGVLGLAAGGSSSSDNRCWARETASRVSVSVPIWLT